MKKYQSELIISAIALLAFSVAQAAEVTSTFTDGATLTATQMTEIKDAVNDNNTNIGTNAAAITTKQNRVTGVCPPGQSIAAINEDGTVSCEVDDGEVLPTIDINATTSSVNIPSDGSTTTAMQVSVTAPDDGFVLVTFTASADLLAHTTGTTSFLRYFLADAEVAHSFVPSWQATEVPAANPTSAGEFRPVSTQRLFPVTASTVHTFYARFNIFSGGDWTVFRPYMSAVFIPTTTGALPAQF